MPDYRDELPNDEEPSGKDGGKVDGDADAVNALAVPVPFARRCAIGEAAAGGTGNVQVGKTREREPQ